MLIFSYLLIGFIIGCLNYAGLILTVRKIKETQKHSIVFLSYLLRMLFITITFAVFMNRDWQTLLLLFLGFILSKVLFLFLVKQKKINF